MQSRRIVSRDEWTRARKAFLMKEKDFTRAREDLAQQRRDLPWTKVEADYVFDGDNGPVSLAELFDGCSQLIVCHFMFHPHWEAGCTSCSFWADGYDRQTSHLKARDVCFVAISSAPLEKLLGYRRRMGWTFPWVSANGSSFNRDFGVSFTPEEIESGEVDYNYKRTNFPVEEAPGLSVFTRDEDGTIFHTYSCYARGLDMMNTAYQLLDLVPKGRDEGDLPFTMAWVRRRDEYGTETA